VSRSDDERLADILDAAAEVAALMADGREAWEADRVRRLAVERLLEIIGEAARALSDEYRDGYPDVPWPDVIGLRTVLAHHYHRVDPNQVWAIAAVELPRLVGLLDREREREKP
jgi:uncharacterized protein with HEPN domain